MDWTDDVWKERYKLIYRCRLSRIYHQKRARFFKLCEGLLIGLGIIAFAVNMEQVFASNDPTSWLSLIITILMFNLPIHHAKMALTHADLAKAFMGIEAKIVTAGILTQEQVDNFLAEILRVEMNEPRSLGALLVICQNEIAEMQGENKFINPVSFVKRATAHFFDWDMSCSPHQALTK